MKRTFALIVAILVSTSLYAAETTGNYLVATRTAAPSKVRVRTVRGEVELNVIAFRAVNGYAARLTDEEVAALRKSPDVRFIERDVERRALEGPVEPEWRTTAAGIPVESATVSAPTATAPQVVPYGIDLVRARGVWPVATGTNIKVGVIDTGIDRTHPDLRDRFQGGYDFVEDDNDPQDGNGHGTHVAGTIAATDNDTGVVGVAPGVQIYSLRVLDNDGKGSSSAVIRAIDWAILNHLNVLNLSLGSSEPSDLEQQAFQRAADAGILTIAAAGNENGGPVDYPAAYPTVIAVGAVDSQMGIASFSNIGPEVALVGPGVRVFSTYPQGRSVTGEIDYSGTTIHANPFPQSPAGDVSGTFVYCNLGQVQDFTSAVRGKIALIKRGDLTFADKTKNAANAGASAVVIFDNVYNGDSSSWTLGTDPFSWPLTVGISREDGEKLLQSTSTPIRVATRADDYSTMSGTSMATPHVAGVAALVWSVAPSATASQVKMALVSSAHDLGATGFDDTYGYGLVDALAAADVLAPSRFVSQSRKIRTRGRR